MPHSHTQRTEQLNLRISPADKTTLEALATYYGQSMASVIVDLIRDRARDIGLVIGGRKVR